MANTKSPLRPIVAKWRHTLKFAWDYKKRTFADDARECMQFFNGPYDWLYQPMNKQAMGMVVNYDEVPSPTFRMSANKVAEMVQLFGPVLYQKNPHRTITARKILQPPVPSEVQAAQQTLQQIQMTMQQTQQSGMPQDPMQFQQMMQAGMQAQQQVQMWDQMVQEDQKKSLLNVSRAMLLDAYLNYTPNEMGLLLDIRMAIDEAIIKGASTLWSENLTLPTGMKVVTSTYDTVDNLLLDPDAEKMEDCWWVARRCQHPVWEVEREYGLPQGTLKPNTESWDGQAEYDPDALRRWKRAQGGTNDIITYWKIYSRMGVGGRLRDADPDYREILDSYGDNAFIVIADGVDYPLNVPDDVIETADDQEIQRRLQWPISYWMNKSWPVEMISFHSVPRQIWPMSHLKPGLGELKFLNWAYSFLATKMPTWGRNFLAMPKSLSEKNKLAIQSGRDLTILEMDAMQQNVNQVLQGWTAGAIQPDFFKMIDMVSQQFERRVGLNELLYGESTKQSRSATDAESKKEAIAIRPNDMRAKLVEQLSNVAQKEAIAAQMTLGPNDLEPILGKAGTMAWQSALSQCQIDDIIHRLDFRIEADDTRVPNREKIAANMQTAIQTIFQLLLNFGQATANYDPINALIADWAKSIDLDADRYKLVAPPPPPPPPPDAPKVSIGITGEQLLMLDPAAAAAVVGDIVSHFPPAPPAPNGAPQQQALPATRPNPMIPGSPPPAAPPA